MKTLILLISIILNTGVYASVISTSSSNTTEQVNIEASIVEQHQEPIIDLAQLESETMHEVQTIRATGDGEVEAREVVGYTIVVVLAVVLVGLIATSGLSGLGG